METLRRTAGQTLIWGLGLGVLSLAVVMMVPLFDMQIFVDLLKGLPPFVRSAVGVGDNLDVLLRPEGFIAVGVFGKMALIFAAYPVIMGLRVTANEEEDGIMDVLMSTPLPRWRIVVEKLAAYALTTAVIALLVLASMWLGAALANIALDMGLMAQIVVNLMPTLLLILALTALAGALLRRRRDALMAATVFVIVSFMFETIGSMGAGSVVENLRQVSVFAASNAVTVMETGMPWSTIALLLALALAFSGGAVWAFQRRDIGV
jgi:ABC-2 type transport system permease protein